jgi:hypothetical protein
MDIKRQKILVRSLRTTGRLYNVFGSQYWTEKREDSSEATVLRSSLDSKGVERKINEDKKPW